MQPTQEQQEIIYYSMLSEPGDSLAHLLYSKFGPSIGRKIQEPSTKRHVADYLAAFYPEQLPNLLALAERFRIRADHADVEAAIEKAARWNAKPVFLDQLPIAEQRFQDLGHHGPYLLWVAGEPSALEHNFAGVVGTREPTATGLNNTSKLVRMLNRPVVSGGAKGIDAASHRAALDIGLPTVAFMAGGIDRAYPLENWSLFHELVRSGGALVSELVPGTAPSRFRFLQRNRLIAAVAKELYVVQAAYRSGSKNTANSARMLGRDVYAIPGLWSDRVAQGTNAMIQEGLAKPFYLGSTPRIDHIDQRRRVEDAIRDGATSKSEIAIESGLTASSVEQVLGELELEQDHPRAVIKM